MNRNAARSLALGALSLALASPAWAQEAGDWTVSVGAHVVNPTSDNGRLAGGALDVDVGNSTRPTFTGEYFFTPNLGLEILAALPFKHDIQLNGVDAGSVKQLPPTFSLQYHFDREKVSPFLGVGVNYTKFFSEDPQGPLSGTRLSLASSWGLAAHFGLDFKLNDKQSLRVDARWMDIDTKVRVNGSDVGTVRIDPWVFGAAYVWTL